MTLTLFAAFGAAQVPERQDKLALADAAAARGRVLLREKKYDDAIAAFREALEIKTKIYGFDSPSHYELAMALTAAGRITEALETFRQGVCWDSTKDELWMSSISIGYAMDYAILLAELGKKTEAKAMYYYGMRRFNEHSDPNRKGFEPTPGGYLEPIPFLVVFDPDPTMVWWDYEAEKLIVAATALKAKGQKLGGIEQLKGVREKAPDWLVPAMDLVWQHFIDGAEADRFAEAASLAKTPEERQWVAAYREVFTTDDWNVQRDRWQEVANKMAAIGAARRKASVVLEQARQNLKYVHHKIAIERDLGG